jgi:hypothetical protein
MLITTIILIIISVSLLLRTNLTRQRVHKRGPLYSMGWVPSINETGSEV